MYFERTTVWLGVTVDKDQSVREPLVCHFRQVCQLKEPFRVRVVCGYGNPSCLVCARIFQKD